MSDTAKKAPGPGFTKADLKQAKKIATGPLLGSAAGDVTAPATTTPATPAPLGSLGAVKAKLGQILDSEP